MAIWRLVARAAMVAAVASTAVVGVGSAAQAVTAADCVGNHGTNWGGGWCDGNGPDWTYRATVTCSNGGTYNGTASHWAGDRRPLYVNCPSGATATLGGVTFYYKGGYRGYKVS